jgi:hypothetical protein
VDEYVTRQAYNERHCTLSFKFPLRTRLQQRVARALIVLLTSHGRDRCLIAVPLTCSPHVLRYLLLKPIWSATEISKFPLTSPKVRSSFIPGCELIRFNDALSPDCIRPSNIEVKNIAEIRTYIIIRVCFVKGMRLYGCRVQQSTFILWCRKITNLLNIR